MHPTKFLKVFCEFKPRPFLSDINVQHSSCGGPVTSGLVLGVYDCPEGGGKQILTEAGERLNDTTNGLIYELLKKQYIKKGKAVLYSHVVPGFSHLALASLGPKNPNRLNFIEQLNEEKENIRLAMAAGARLVQDEGANKISVDGATVPESAAEGSILATYKYKANITSGDRSNPTIELYDHKDTNSWASGEINAEAQNWARFLSHAPPNFKRPLLYANEVMDKLCKFDIRIDARNKDWMMNRKMYATLGMIKNSSCEPPILLELGYCGDEPKAKPVCFVGKGNIFDSGGLFMKSYKGIHEFRADMGGAAAICATIMAAARKRLPINIRGVIILYEMMPAPMSLKPGDVLKDKDGTYIRISDPDNDCRVAFSDLVNFTEYYSPSIVVGVGTFTKAVAHALGLAASGLFSPQTSLWHEFQRAGLESGDRLWRMPLWQYFNKLNRSNRSIDLDNGTSSTGGDSCQAAAFVNEFVPKVVDCCCPKPTQYVHLDCFNTALLSQTDEEVEPYYREGIKMGRPTRALIQFLYHRACFLNTQKSKSQKK